jgi:hypothetical protein
MLTFYLSSKIPDLGPCLLSADNELCNETEEKLVDNINESIQSYLWFQTILYKQRKQIMKTLSR